MTCSRVMIDGKIVFLKHSGPRLLPCSYCGEISTRLCDWKLEGGTCDAPLCDRHTTSPAHGKDLCEVHAETWARHPDNVKAGQKDLFP